MADTDAREAARALVAHRWGSQVVERAARTVVERAAELPPTLRAQVHLATADDREDGDD
jgi:hypothetical protein